MQARNIDEVISFLNEVIDDSKLNQSRLGYFAALYHGVTVKVRDGIVNWEFEDNERMERLDVVFANRYLQAYTDFTSGEKASECWAIAFEQSQRFWPVVLQHLLLGMNAHINLDLGIAAAEIAPGDKIDGLRNDFNKINDILAGLVESVENDLARVWPPLKWILAKTAGTDSFLVNFSMKLARDGAWKFATTLAPLDQALQAEAIGARDGKVGKKAPLITNPGIIAGIIFKIIRIGERGTVAEQIDWLGLKTRSST